MSLIEDSINENLGSIAPLGYLSKTNRPLGAQSWDPEQQKSFAQNKARDLYTKKEPAPTSDRSPENQAYVDQLRKNRKAEYDIEDEMSKDVKTRVVPPPEKPGQQSPVASNQNSAMLTQNPSAAAKPNVSQILKMINQK